MSKLFQNNGISIVEVSRRYVRITIYYVSMSNRGTTDNYA